MHNAFANFQSTAGNVIHDAEANGKLNGNKTEEKSGETKYSNHTLEEVASMVNSTLSVLDAKVPYISYVGFDRQLHSS